MARSDPGQYRTGPDPWQEWARRAGRASGGCGLYGHAWTAGIADAADFVLAISCWLDAGLPRALSSEVDTGSREKTRQNRED
jgi:hypothetical protein